MTEKSEIADWQERLSVTFRGPSGMVGDRLNAVFAAEAANLNMAAMNTSGFTVLMDCFQDFYIQTFEEMVHHKPVKNINVCAILMASFRRLRSYLLGFYRGYPYDSAAGIRPLFENAFFLGAVLNGIVKHDDLFSFASAVDSQSDSAAKIFRVQRDHLRALDKRINEEMRGSQSGLSEEDQQTIARMLRPLNWHVHRAQSSIMSLILDWTKIQTLGPFCPQFDVRTANHVATPMVFVCWLLLRVLPFISRADEFSPEWRRRYSALDESFEFYVVRSKSSASAAFTRLVTRKFTFDSRMAWNNVRVESAKLSGQPEDGACGPC